MKLNDEPANKLRGKPVYTGVLFGIVCIGFGILYVRPVSPDAWFIAIGIMAPTFWLIFVSPEFLRVWMSRGPYVFKSWIVLAAKLAFFGLVAKVAVPFIERIITEWLHA